MDIKVGTSFNENSQVQAGASYFLILKQLAFTQAVGDNDPIIGINEVLVTDTMDSIVGYDIDPIINPGSAVLLFHAEDISIVAGEASIQNDDVVQGTIDGLITGTVVHVYGKKANNTLLFYGTAVISEVS